MVVDLPLVLILDNVIYALVVLPPESPLFSFIDYCRTFVCIRIAVSPCCSSVYFPVGDLDPLSDRLSNTQLVIRNRLAHGNVSNILLCLPYSPVHHVHHHHHVTYHQRFQITSVVLRLSCCGIAFVIGPWASS